MFKENFNSLETRVETENSAEPKNERQELLEEILAIKNLPVEKLINRYKSFDIDEGFIGGKSLSKEDAIVVLNLIEDNSGYEEISEEKMAYDYLSELFSDQIENPRYAINSLKKWIEEDQDRIKVVTEKVISLLKSKKKTTINLFIFLAEIDVYRQEKLMTDDGKILAELDRVLNSSLMHFANSYIDQMAVLNRLNNKRANFELHKILDFVRDFMADSQNFVGGSDELLYYFERFAEGEIDFANNYLLKQHLKEIIEIRNLSWSEKEDFVNIPGGNTDQTIYSYKHARESYENRIKFGINKGYPLRSLVLPISDELFGTYQDGKFWGIIEETDQDFSTRIQSYIKQNKPDDNFIYGQLNQEPNLPPNYVNKYEIHQRKVLLNFEIHKKAEEGEFFFDLSLLNWDIIDPVIRGSILTYNQMYLHTKEDQVNKTGTIPEEELKNIIFPLKNYSEEEEYNYEYLMSLSMRKKIEDDFGLKMEEFSLWEQRNFLSYLERASIEKVEEIKKFIKDFDHDGIKGFLSVEYGIEMGEKILDIGKGNPERAKAIFKDYSQIIDFAEDFNRAVLPAIQAASHKGFDKQIFFNSLMYQGKQFLHFCFDYIQQRPQASYHEIYTEVAKEHSSLDPKNCAEGIAGGAIVELVNQVGLERARAIFNRAFNETDDSVIKEQIERALSFIVLPSTKPIHSLQDFYQNIIDFSQYAYPTQDFEEDFLQKHIEKKDKTLDLG
ncbi:MAG: hypothetical protein NTV62_03260, partial [Candidatus Gribaldobacteria bacterium]|nr:hypothetical protein [Candidatus Gribaldobacteria bacterium]